MTLCDAEINVENARKLVYVADLNLQMASKIPQLWLNFTFVQALSNKTYQFTRMI